MPPESSRDIFAALSSSSYLFERFERKSLILAYLLADAHQRVKIVYGLGNEHHLLAAELLLRRGVSFSPNQFISPVVMAFFGSIPSGACASRLLPEPLEPMTA